jgi:hypothetical protein
MPSYQTTPFKPSPSLLVAGTPQYVFGSFNDRVSPTLGTVISDAAVTTTATLVFQIRAGNVPAVSSLITVRGTANSAGVFNTTNATILTVSCTDAGVCTVTYAISSTTQVTRADGGEVEVPQPEVPETLANGASVPVVYPFNNAVPDNARGVTVVAAFPSLPTAATIVLQQAVVDKDSEYATVATVATVAGGVVTAGGQITVDPTLGRFYRVLVSGVSGGTLPTVIVKFLI